MVPGNPLSGEGTFCGLHTVIILSLQMCVFWGVGLGGIGERNEKESPFLFLRIRALVLKDSTLNLIVSQKPTCKYCHIED